MIAIDPARARQLIAEARDCEMEWDRDAANAGTPTLSSDYVEGWNNGVGAYVFALADQLEAALAEIERLRVNAEPQRKP